MCLIIALRFGFAQTSIYLVKLLLLITYLKANYLPLNLDSLFTSLASTDTNNLG
jgi:hypothetical protein